MRRLILAISLVSMSGAPFLDAAGQNASDAFAAGSRAFADGDYLRALAAFQSARDMGSPGPAVHYNIGVCNYRLGNYPQAAEAFEMVAGFPRMRSLGQYNLGLVRLRQNRDAEARRLFEQAKAGANDPKIAQLADSALQRTRPPADSSPAWTRFVDFSIGHDSNVALVDDATFPIGQSVDSSFTELVAVLSGPASSSSRLRFDGSVYSVRYADAGEFDQSALRVGGVYRWSAAAWRFEVGPHFSYSTLDGDGFEERLGAGIDLKRGIGPATVLGIRAVHDEVGEGDSRFAFVEGSRTQLRVTVDRYSPRGRLTIAYDFEDNDRLEPGVSPQRGRFSLRYRHSMNPYWEADVWIAQRSAEYDDLPTTRNEDLTELSMGFFRDLGRGWQVSGSYLWADNDSTVAALSYTRNRISLGLIKNF